MTGGMIKRRRMLVVICAMLLVAAALLITVYQSAVSQADYNNGYEIGLEAYTYGLPLLVTNTTFETMTSINVPDGAFGPVNQFNNVRSLNNPDSTAVVAPSPTSLSSIAWLDLSKEPQVLHVPEVKDHFFVFSFIDPYTNNIANLGSVNQTPPGDYVIAGPGQYTVPIPAGTHRIDVDYNRIWIIGVTRAERQLRHCKCYPHPGWLHPDAIEPVRDELPAEQSDESQCDPPDLSNTRRARILRYARTTACAVSTASSRPARARPVRGGWDRARDGTLA